MAKSLREAIEQDVMDELRRALAECAEVEKRERSDPTGIGYCRVAGKINAYAHAFELLRAAVEKSHG